MVTPGEMENIRLTAEMLKNISSDVIYLELEIGDNLCSSLKKIRLYRLYIQKKRF